MIPNAVFTIISIYIAIFKGCHGLVNRLKLDLGMQLCGAFIVNGTTL